MEITWIQAVLLALCALLFNDVGALGPTIGTFTFARPLVGSLLVGLIVGDVSSAILVGAAMQIIYIALITPGGTASADVRAVTYIGIPLALVSIHSSGLEPGSSAANGLAVSLGALVGSVGTIMYYSTATVNIYLPSAAWRGVANFRPNRLYLANFVLPLGTHFVISFLPTLFITKYGADVVQNIHEWLPIDSLFMKTMFIVGMMLPAVGIGILLKQMVVRAVDLLTFFFGFVLAGSMGINIVAAAIVGGMIAFINYKIHMSKATPETAMRELVEEEI
ncbi:PTS sugar transporter subunit IIC [Microbacterium sp.]|uniref:PTS sugar transporter subunit IIC n=1 Tax=Microbacterium sp. TaxID=51671 RepID=UPI0039E46A1C